MTRQIFFIGLIFFSFICFDFFTHSSLETVPVLFQGRCRPLLACKKENIFEGFYGEKTVEKSQFLERLKEYKKPLQVLPGPDGEWYHLSALRIELFDQEQLIKTPNFTLYDDQDFLSLKLLYEEFSLNPTDQNLLEKIGSKLISSYKKIAKIPYLSSFGKEKSYPSYLQIAIEAFLYRYPLFLILLILYSVASFFLLKKRSQNFGVFFFFLALSLHTFLLLLRTYILNRPPVSNMTETALYVPWIVSLTAFYFWKKFKQKETLLMTSFSIFVFLLLLFSLNISFELENVPPVLDSNFWLTIHVLMVVGSYGFFALSSLFSHVYLFSNKNKKSLFFLFPSLLTSLYLGTAFLIIGTFLGGVWAAQSWGRFWDWDPKESWAFISSCTYLIFIHLYRLKKITTMGVALGSILGFLSISFTWYGVNYLLGTGLHSYGFGFGGEKGYFLFLFLELLFLFWVIQKVNKKEIINR